MIGNIVYILILTKGVLSRLVISEADLDSIDRHIIEEKASLVDYFLRDTGCKGVRVILFHILNNLKHIYLSRNKYLCMNIL